MTGYKESVLASIHEAGHAVAAWVLGGTVLRVTMQSCESEEVNHWSRAVVCCAGALAARQADRALQVHNDPARRMSPQDRDVAEMALGKIGLGASYIDQAKAEARELVLDHLPTVRRVADALRVSGELTGADVERIASGDALAVKRREKSRGRDAAVPNAPQRARADRGAYSAADEYPADAGTLRSWRGARVRRINGALQSFEGGYVSLEETDRCVAELEAEIAEIDARLASASIGARRNGLQAA